MQLRGKSTGQNKMHLSEFYLEEPSNSCSSTLVPVHPGHEASSLDVCSSCVVSDALECFITDIYNKTTT